MESQKAKAEVKAVEGSLTELDPWPSYIQERIALWNKLKVAYDAEIAAKTPNPIKITLPDGQVLQGESWRTSPLDIAKQISQGLADNAVISKVNGVLWDLERPLESDSNLEILKFNDEEAQKVFWHSTAHIMGEAMERLYGGWLCYGPPIGNGFYYDMFLEDRQVSEHDFPSIENLMKAIVKEKQPFERLEMKKEDLLEMFKYNHFKVRIINERINTPTTTVYKCGSLIDLCLGPHVRHTGKVKALKVTKTSPSHWEGKSDAESLQRVYGISFPDSKQLKEWEKIQEEAAQRDHRKIGLEQSLYFFHELSPGSCFFEPRGAYIYNTLIEFIRSEYRKRGFQEVITPNIYNTKLWQTSGHWGHYAENMFSFKLDNTTYAMKPMNCPGHCLIFDRKTRSWRELPLRLADFGVLHRNEVSGSLTGLTRVRRFQQDDAHIFCTVEQIKDEILGALDFLKSVYGVFGFSFQLRLSTRPEKFMGEPAMWDEAEKQLADSLEKFGYPWKLNPGDGAFYGPKIDITIEDALKRRHQCATIQLDFQLPIRFNLTYICETGVKRPVIIHRAILGSVERMIAILVESYGGKWPFWLSPMQCVVMPIVSAIDDYALKVKDALFEAGFNCDLDVDPGDSLNKKIRNATLGRYNFILVVGEKERAAGTINVRGRGEKKFGEFTVEEVIKRFQRLKDEKIITDDF